MCSEFFTALAEVTTVCTTLNKMKLFIYNRDDKDFLCFIRFHDRLQLFPADSEKIPIFYPYINTWTI